MSIEEEFFKTFGIEQEYQYHVRDRGRYYVGNKQMLIDKKHLFMDKERKRSRRLYVANVSKIYPEITDRILLELICILNTVTEPDLGEINYARLRIAIIEQCIKAVTEVDWTNREPSKEEFVEDVRSLFEEVKE